MSALRASSSSSMSSMSSARTTKNKLTRERPSPFHINVPNVTTHAPSLSHSLTAESEVQMRAETADFISQMGQVCKITQWTIATASVYMHVVFAHFSLLSFDRFEIAATCLFLAGKVEERRIRVDQVINAYYQVRLNPSALSKSSQVCPVLLPTPNSAEWEAFRLRMYTLEFAVLDCVEFVFELSHPYTNLMVFIRDTIFGPSYANMPEDKIRFETSEKGGLAQIAWLFINDSLRSTLCLRYPPDVICVGVIALSLKYKNMPEPTRYGAAATPTTKPWHEELFNVDQATIDHICDVVLTSVEQRYRADPSQAAAVLAIPANSQLHTIAAQRPLPQWTQPQGQHGQQKGRAPPAAQSQQRPAFAPPTMQPIQSAAAAKSQHQWQPSEQMSHSAARPAPATGAAAASKPAQSSVPAKRFAWKPSATKRKPISGTTVPAASVPAVSPVPDAPTRPLTPNTPPSPFLAQVSPLSRPPSPFLSPKVATSPSSSASQSRKRPHSPSRTAAVVSRDVSMSLISRIDSQQSLIDASRSMNLNADGEVVDQLHLSIQFDDHQSQSLSLQSNPSLTHAQVLEEAGLIEDIDRFHCELASESHSQPTKSFHCDEPRLKRPRFDLHQHQRILPTGSETPELIQSFDDEPVPVNDATIGSQLSAGRHGHGHDGLKADYDGNFVDSDFETSSVPSSPRSRAMADHDDDHGFTEDHDNDKDSHNNVFNRHDDVEADGFEQRFGGGEVGGAKESHLHTNAAPALTA